MRTSVVLLGWDEAHLLEHSLPALAAEQPSELIVVDVASADATGEVAAAHGARVIALADRRSYAAAMNAGLAAATGDAVLLTNADCFCTPGLLAAMVARLADPGVGSVAPRLVRTGGPHVVDRLDAIDAAGLVVDRRRKNTLVGHGRPSLAYDTPAEAFGGDGAAVLYRRTTLDACAVDGEVLDEDMERWASDVDLAWRARTLGWRCAYEPVALAYHVRSYSPSTRGAMPAADRRMQFRNRYLMMAKNDTPAALLSDLRALAPYELGALLYALVAERELLGGYRDALRLLPGALRRRRALRGARRTAGSPSVPLGLEAPA